MVDDGQQVDQNVVPFLLLGPACSKAPNYFLFQQMGIMINLVECWIDYSNSGLDQYYNVTQEVNVMKIASFFIVTVAKKYAS